MTKEIELCRCAVVPFPYKVPLENKSRAGQVAGQMKWLVADVQWWCCSYEAFCHFAIRAVPEAGPRPVETKVA